MKRKQHTAEDAREVQESLNVKGFGVEVSGDGEYFRLYFGKSGNDGILLFCDSACSDAYSVDGAIALFNSMLEEIEETQIRWRGIVAAALNLGFDSGYYTDLDSVLIDAEAYIIKNTEIEDCGYFVVSDFWQNHYHNSTTVTYYDDDNQCCFDGTVAIADDYERNTWYRLVNNKLQEVEWMCHADPDVYVCLDKIVTSQGKVVILIA